MPTATITDEHGSVLVETIGELETIAADIGNEVRYYIADHGDTELHILIKD
jgi:hypothetical protein